MEQKNAKLDIDAHTALKIAAATHGLHVNQLLACTVLIGLQHINEVLELSADRTKQELQAARP